MTRRNGRKQQNVVVRWRRSGAGAARTVLMMLMALLLALWMEAHHAPLVLLVHAEDGSEAAASGNFLGDLLSALFPSWFPCGVFSAATGCGLFNFGALMRQGEPETAECEDVCTYFAGLSSSYSGYECGSCGATTGETPTPPVAPTATPPTPPVDDDNFEITLDLQVRSGIGNVFRQAAARWEEVVVGGLPDLTNVPNAPNNRPCTYPNDVVDDLYICVYEDEIDGKGKTIGYAGVDYTRGTGRKLPVLSYAYFDEDDLDDGANTASWFKNLVVRRSSGFVLDSALYAWSVLLLLLLVGVSVSFRTPLSQHSISFFGPTFALLDPRVWSQVGTVILRSLGARILFNPLIRFAKLTFYLLFVAASDLD